MCECLRTVKTILMAFVVLVVVLEGKEAVELNLQLDAQLVTVKYTSGEVGSDSALKVESVTRHLFLKLSQLNVKPFRKQQRVTNQYTIDHATDDKWTASLLIQENGICPHGVLWSLNGAGVWTSQDDDTTTTPDVVLCTGNDVDVTKLGAGYFVFYDSKKRTNTAIAILTPPLKAILLSSLYNQELRTVPEIKSFFSKNLLKHFSTYSLVNVKIKSEKAIESWTYVFAYHQPGHTELAYAVTSAFDSSTSMEPSWNFYRYEVGDKDVDSKIEKIKKETLSYIVFSVEKGGHADKLKAGCALTFDPQLHGLAIRVADCKERSILKGGGLEFRVPLVGYDKKFSTKATMAKKRYVGNHIEA